MTDEQQIARLREEIRRAGRYTRWTRLGVGSFFLIPAFATLGTTVVMLSWSPRTRIISDVPGVNGTRSVTAISPDANALLIAFWVLLACIAAFLAAGLYRAFRRFLIRQHLARLHPHQIAEVLLPLRDERGDTRKIVTPLLRQFGIPSELMPAAAPDGRGDEAAGT